MMSNILPVSFNALYIFAGIVLLEFIVFLIFVSKRKLNILRGFFAVLCGNAISTAFCLFLPAGNGQELGFGYYAWLTCAFILAVVFEWVIYIAFYRNRENRVSNTRFFFCSLIGNLVTFAVLGLLSVRGLIH